MTNISYTGSFQSAKDLTYLLTSSGFTVLCFTPNENPKTVTEYFERARKTFPPQAVEKGNPRDYRAMVVSPDGQTFLVQLPIGGTLAVQSPTFDGVKQWQPETQNQPEHLSVWSSPSTGQTIEVFFWDGTDLGFSDLLCFFQTNGCLLNELKPEAGPNGFPLLKGKGTRLSQGQTFEFDMTKQTVYYPSEVGNIASASPQQIQSLYTRVR